MADMDEVVRQLADTARQYTEATGNPITHVICIWGHRRSPGTKCPKCHQDALRRWRTKERTRP